MVEILISLVLGLVLVVGVTSMAVGSRKTSVTEQNLVDIQATGRAALQVITKELRKAGYRRDPELALVDAFPADSAPSWLTDKPFSQAGSVVGRSVMGWAKRGFTVRYQGSGEAWDTDCKGEAIAAGATAWSSLFISDGYLRCSTARDANDHVLVLQGVEDLSVIYGVDNDGDSFADEYKAVDDVTDWSRVASVNVQVRIVSAQDNLADSPQPYVDFSGTVVTPSDRRLRRTYATVVALRNVLP